VPLAARRLAGMLVSEGVKTFTEEDLIAFPASACKRGNVLCYFYIVYIMLFLYIMQLAVQSCSSLKQHENNDTLLGFQFKPVLLTFRGKSKYCRLASSSFFLPHC